MAKKKMLIEVMQKLIKVIDDQKELADSIRDLCGSLIDGMMTPEAPDKPEVSMETVRGVLANKSRAGHTAEIREILKKYGADRLSMVDPKFYDEIMKEVEGLTDE